MATVIIMPKQGQSVESCIVSEFKKKKGDKVSKGDILFAYETDKASFEEESPVDGTVLDVFFGDGDEIPVLQNVMVIGQEGESTAEFNPNGGGGDVRVSEPEPVQPVKEEIAEVKIEDVKSTPQMQASGEKSVGISPRARALADKEAVSLSDVRGTGPKGRIIERDVKAVAESRPKMTPLAKEIAKETGSVPQAGTGLAGKVTGADVISKNPVYSGDFEMKPLTNMRKLIAKAMHASLQNSAQLTHHLSADARRILELRKKVKAAMDKGTGANITLNDMVCFAVIKALKKFPQVNAQLLGDSMKLFNKVHLALAVDTDRGLMVPVVKNADDLSIQGLSNQFKEIANACKKGSIDPDLLAADAASFTVSNLGNYGVEIFTPVINLPQVAILGVNTIVPRPKDLGDGVYGFVPHIGLSLTYDHRALDGGEATRFVKQVAIEIENLDFDI
ncbi:MAG: 2-oxo acid dehydrogenase subunit E2 [Rikenellaceae bacterium]|nr:2-oxo acid dehydrogenase subunit E2 [Rikenellaceae bacterium]